MKMREVKSFPWVPVTIFTAFGLLCFFVGFLAANISNKKAMGDVQSRLFECQNRFLAFSKDVIANTNRVVQISEGVSDVWNKAVLAKADFNARIEGFLDQNKDSIEGLNQNHKMIEEQLSELKRSMREGQDQYEAVIDMYSIYKKIFELGMPPIGTLEGFNSGRESLLLKFNEAKSRLYGYMPQLNDTEMAQGGVGPYVDFSTAVEKAKPSELIKKIVNDMSYRQVESLLGVPRDKKKDSSGHEVWIYSSDKAGFRNCVYFGSGKVLQSKILPFNSNID
jgi:hypothetical protein